MSGYGEYYYEEGGRKGYRGYFYNHMRNGPGELKYPDGRIEKGLWQNKVLVQPDPNLRIADKEDGGKIVNHVQKAIAYQQLPNGQVQAVPIIRVVKFEAGSNYYPDKPGYDPMLPSGSK